MSKPKQSIDQRIAKCIKTWEDVAPEAKFAGMILAEYRLAVNPSLEIRNGMETKRNELRAAISARRTADETSKALTKRVIHSILADAAYGPNSPLYRAMQYVPENEARTGRPRLASETTSSATAAPSAK